MSRVISASEREDRLLMKKLASGDQSALDRLYRKHAYVIKGFVSQKLFESPGVEVKDIVQETFQRVQRKAHLYEPSGKVLSWIRKLAKNIIIDIGRQHSSRRTRDTDYALANPPQGGEAAEYESTNDWVEMCTKEKQDAFYVVPREGGGSNFVWVQTFPMQPSKWGWTDKKRKWLMGYGKDNVRGMFRPLGLVREDE